MRRHPRRLPDNVDSVKGSQEVADMFGSKTLIYGVSCNKKELEAISIKIGTHIKLNRLASEHNVTAFELDEAFNRLKASKSEGLCGVSFDFFINRTIELYVELQCYLPVCRAWIYTILLNGK